MPTPRGQSILEKNGVTSPAPESPLNRAVAPACGPVTSLATQGLIIEREQAPSTLSPSNLVEL